MQPESQNSISSAVFGLQNSLRKLQQDCSSLQKPTDDNQVQPNELHALGTINLDKAREEFAQQINIIRSVCSQFETEVLGDVMKMGVGADPAFRKHFTHLKEQAALESTVIRVKDTLKNTKEFLEKSLREKEESKSKIETQRLEKLAQSMGLVTFIDSHKFESGVPITTITLGGTVIVIDIDIDESGRVLRSKVTYVSETLQNGQDDRVDNMLAENLQSRNFDLFTRNLKSLALLDQLNVKYESVNFFSITKELLNDLKDICRQETSIESNLKSVLLEGHGIPNLHLDYPGISISYWMCKNAISGSNWDQIQQAFEMGQNDPALHNTSKLLISFEDSIQPMCYLPASRPRYSLGFDESEESIKEGIDGEHFKVVTETSAPKFMPHLSFVKPLPSNPSIRPIPVRFVATLDPPMPVADEISQKLMTVTGLVNADNFSNSTANNNNNNNTSKDTIQTQSLEDMLVAGIDQDVSSQNSEWVSTSDDMPDQVYKWMSSSPTKAKMVSRIPFHHPVQLYNILQCLRQQQMFNTLFKSVFNAETFKKESSKSKSQNDRILRVEVATVDAPDSINIALTPPPLPNQAFIIVPLSIEIPVDNPTRPVIRLHAPCSSKTHTWNPRVFDQDQMTDILQDTHNIANVFSWLYKKMVDTETYLIERGSKRARIEDNFDELNDFNNTKYTKMEIDE
ncbi:hypothetical protein HPULCUR_000296 [Helicostylum pulchrum]|uniref:Mediator of RNA polymerase II transcription subunit 1 n=1 Tax=Helicostylum pulchrum TaxID=562976 RepID=A0ABP9XJH9_9FUNG